MSNISDRLFKLQDEKYRELQIRILPNLNPETIIGVRTPELRKIAKEMIREEYDSYLKELPHEYFDENQLHAFIISKLKDYNECIKYVNDFLPYVDNWATCDQLSPKSFKRHTNELLNEIKKWINSKKTYKIRFGIGMLMQYYLDSNFKKDYLEMVSSIESDQYYVNMMIAWYFATALSKQYDSTITYIENKKLDKWVHNKTIQKAVESHRITEEQKEYLKKFRIK